jgi:hypothetical protein
MTGVVEPGRDGKVTVLNTRDARELLATKVDMPADLDKIQTIYLLRDAEQFYVVFYLLPNMAANPINMPQSNVQPMLRSKPVNGKIYAFDRATGKFRWFKDIKNQYMILTEFEELPVMLLTSGYQQMGAMAGRGQRMCVTTIIDKRTGKLLNDNSPHPSYNAQTYYTLTSNRSAGTIDLIGNGLKWHHSPDEPADSRPGESDKGRTPP